MPSQKQTAEKQRCSTCLHFSAGDGKCVVLFENPIVKKPEKTVCDCWAYDWSNDLKTLEPDVFDVHYRWVAD